MRTSLSLERVPIESRDSIVSFAVIRAMIAVAALAALAMLGFPYGAGATLVLACLVLPWATAMLVLARRSPATALSPWIAVGDILVLAVLQAVEPETYGPVHFAALFMVASHAHFQGENLGLLVGGVAAAALIPVSLWTDVPVSNSMLHAYEPLFAVCALSTALVVGSLRTAESSGRLRARALSRRTIDTELQVRRQLSRAIHDGPIQELAGVELILGSAAQALGRGDVQAARDRLADASALTRANVTFLRDEIVQLGPYAFEERSFDQAVADCVDTWKRRYGVEMDIDVASATLAPEVAGPLFRITQEAVTNAGKHGQPDNVAIRLQCRRNAIVLEISDDGRGFGDVDPSGPGDPGHIGLASMRERAEMLGGQLDIESSDGGTTVRVSVPA